ncbi:MAG: hypothetical protein IT314_03105 [Anaerolineales bacterium]|nr:hypothetical protein [Anaerolineales bacterium]
MTEEKTYTISQAHYHFAVDFSNQTWELLERKNRSRLEDVRMVDFAYASLAHWRSVGGSVRQQRGEWLISRVHAVLGEGGPALKHAQLCYQLLENNKGEMDDADVAFTYEAIARAYAVNGDKKEAQKYIELAKKAGEEIKNDKDRDNFFVELNGGDWNGVK